MAYFQVGTSQNRIGVIGIPLRTASVDDYCAISAIDLASEKYRVPVDCSQVAMDGDCLIRRKISHAQLFAHIDSAGCAVVSS